MSPETLLVKAVEWDRKASVETTTSLRNYYLAKARACRTMAEHKQLTGA